MLHSRQHELYKGPVCTSPPPSDSHRARSMGWPMASVTASLKEEVPLQDNTTSWRFQSSAIAYGSCPRTTLSACEASKTIRTCKPGHYQCQSLSAGTCHFGRPAGVPAASRQHRFFLTRWADGKHASSIGLMESAEESSGMTWLPIS